MQKNFTQWNYWKISMWEFQWNFHAKTISWNLPSLITVHKCAVKPANCSWYRIFCRTSHNCMDCHPCVFSYAPLDYVWRRMREDTSDMYAADVRCASTCVSAGLSDAGKPGRRPRTPPVFPRCGHARARAATRHSRRCANIWRNDISASGQLRCVHKISFHQCR